MRSTIRSQGVGPRDAMSTAQDYGDTPYVQTPQNVVDKMLEVAKVGPKDFVIDLGSGDGRIVLAAARRGTSGTVVVELLENTTTFARSAAASAGRQASSRSTTPK